jgi:peptide deformylase
MNALLSTFGRKTTGAGNRKAGRSQPPRLSLVYYPDPVLRALCRPVERFDSALRDLVQEMFSLMQVHAGIGLAGPQVAVEQRVLVCALEDRQLCLTNPTVQPAGVSGEFVESCLSLPDTYISVTRPERIEVTGYDARGRKLQWRASGLWARVIQHELDHLNGILITDRGLPPAQPCGPCSLAVPAELIEQREPQSARVRSNP